MVAIAKNNCESKHKSDEEPSPRDEEPKSSSSSSSGEAPDLYRKKTYEKLPHQSTEIR
jgi:hypothetical protein